MTFIATVIFPIVSIATGVVVLVSLTRFVAEIYRDSRGGRP